MKPKLSPKLQPIYDLELALGNTVARIDEPGQVALPLTIVFEEPLHRSQIESAIRIVPPIKWCSVGKFGGYVCEDSQQSVQGPMPEVHESGQTARRKLSPKLQPIYDLELALGNTVARIDEPAGSLCPLAIIFKNPLHKVEIASTLLLPASVKWWENRDSHYPLESGYGCDETGHAVAGPLR